MKLKHTVVTISGKEKKWEATITGGIAHDDRYEDAPYSIVLVMRFPDEAMIGQFIADMYDTGVRT